MDTDMGIVAIASIFFSVLADKIRSPSNYQSESLAFVRLLCGKTRSELLY